MGKTGYFASELLWEWPKPQEIEHYFLAPRDERWFFETGNDGALFTNEGVDGTEHLQLGKGRIDVELMMWANPDLGVLLIWSKWGGGHEQNFTSKGDLSRLREFVESSHDTPLPVGLFIPFEKAWTAVKEFLETDGELPKSIEWVANRDLPPNTFPDQGDVEIPRRDARR
jgi:immunity protein Imm1 of predicted polymorphic toxin system